ncbi:MAG: hypothetical protein LUM44_14755 [Pyrinomonadaceae bacterium]|nr:hypothetical protein [Pyrinomonadaceae bacterium]
MEEDIDYYERLENAKKDYEEESANLLQMIEKREEMVRLLKIAKPDKIKDIQELIRGLDESIAQTEEIMESISNLIEKIEAAIKHDEKLAVTVEIIQKELIEYVKREKPEKLEELEAMLFEDGTSH